MGNGRELQGNATGKTSSGGSLIEKSKEEISRRSTPQIAIAAGGFILLLVAGLLLASGSRRIPQTALSRFPLSQHRPALERPSSSSLQTRSLQPKPDARALLGQLPLVFEPNHGEEDSSIQFVSRGPGYSLYLDQAGAILATPVTSSSPKSNNPHRVQTIRMKLAGANPSPALVGNNALPGKTNYFLGNDSSKWKTNIPQFAGVRYQSVYPGIDLVFYGKQGRLEYDFKVAPGADPSKAELQFDGAGKLEIKDGDLLLKGTSTGVRFQAPRIYQEVSGRQQPVDGRFVLRAANRVGFEVGSYDHSRELVIDPTVNYSTYFGGSGNETYPSVAVNGDGYIYLSGSTTSTNLPVTTNAYQSTLTGAQNIFVLKLDPTQGTGGIIYLTYLGGSGTDTSAGIAVDNGSNVYVTGSTTSTNFPTTSANAYQAVPLAGSTGTQHVFVSEISGLAAGTPVLNYSTYLSGNGTDTASAIALDTNANVYITGTTTSTNPNPTASYVFPASYSPKPFQQQPAGTLQFFVTEVNTKTSSTLSVPYSTYFGGANLTGTVATGGGIAVDTTGNVYFSGTTNMYNSGEGTNGVGGLLNTDFPILNAYQPCLDTPVPSTIIPPITCTAPATSPYPTDAFVAKLNPANAQTASAQLLFSTYLGGEADDSSTGLAIDTGAANVYITGSTDSGSSPTSLGVTLPTGSGAFQTCLDTPVNVSPCPTIAAPAPTDAYVARFTNETEAAGTTATQVPLSYYSYLGGTGNDTGLSIAVDTAGGALITGATSSTDFPASVGAIQTTLNGVQNAFFARVNTQAISGNSSVATYVTYYGGSGTDRGTSIAVDPSLNTYFAGDTNSPSPSFQVQGAVQPCLDSPGAPLPCPTITAPAPTDAFAVQLLNTSDLCINCVPVIYSPASQTIGAGNAITITFTLQNNGPDLATNIAITGQVGTGAAFTSGTAATAGSGTCSAATGQNVVCTIPALQAGSTSVITYSVTPINPGSFTVTSTVTDSNSANRTITGQGSFTAYAYAVSVSPSSQTVVAGNIAPYDVQVTPSGTFGNNVSLTCSNLPPATSCGFTPSTLAFNGPSPLPSQLNLTTTARPITTISSIDRKQGFYALWLMFPGLALLGVGKRKRVRILAGLGLLTVLTMIIVLPACSKSKQQPVVSGTPAGTYAIQVTATSGTFTRSQGITLTVQ